MFLTNNWASSCFEVFDTGHTSLDLMSMFPRVDNVLFLVILELLAKKFLIVFDRTSCLQVLFSLISGSFLNSLPFLSLMGEHYFKNVQAKIDFSNVQKKRLTMKEDLFSQLCKVYCLISVQADALTQVSPIACNKLKHETIAIEQLLLFCRLRTKKLRLGSCSPFYDFVLTF